MNKSDLAAKVAKVVSTKKEAKENFVFPFNLLIFTLVLVLCLVIVGTTHATPIQNAGFENGLAFWSVSSGTATYSPDSVVVKIGTGSARGEETDRGSLGRLYQDVTNLLIPEEEYVISGWIKTEGVSTDGGGVVLGLNYVNSFGWTPANGYIQEIGDLKGTNDWTFFQSNPFILPTMPVDTSALWFLTDFNDSSGTAWFDDVALTGPVVPEPATMLLLGSGLIGLAGFSRKFKK